MMNKQTTKEVGISAERYIDDYFKRIGIGSPAKPEHFWKTLSKKFGKAAETFGDCVESRERGDQTNPYPLKNQDLEFANTIASQFDSAKLRAVALWFIKEHQINIESKNILEIGCDNGILLCLFAEIYPNTHFIGIDPCSEAITLAKQRALNLDLNNIEFICLTTHEYSTSIEESYEVILSVTVFHEILADTFITSDLKLMTDSTAAFSIEDMDDQFSAQCPLINDLVSIKKLLAPSGRFISIDRWGTHNETLKWVRMVEKAELSLLLPLSFIIKYKEFAYGPQYLPATVFTIESKHQVRACDILSFKAYPHFVELPALHVIKETQLAEMIYSALDKSEVYFHEAEYLNGSGKMQLHVGVANGLGFMYTTSNQNFRELSLLPSALLYERFDEINNAREQLEKVGKVTYRWGDPHLLAQIGISLI